MKALVRRVEFHDRYRFIQELDADGETWVDLAGLRVGVPALNLGDAHGYGVCFLIRGRDHLRGALECAVVLYADVQHGGVLRKEGVVLLLRAVACGPSGHAFAGPGGRLTGER